jgi:hypothetical protein
MAMPLAGEAVLLERNFLGGRFYWSAIFWEGGFIGESDGFIGESDGFIGESDGFIGESDSAIAPI